MKNSFIYHGGGPLKGKNSSGGGGSSSTRLYLLNYGTNASIGVNTMVNPPSESGVYASTGQGYYIGANAHIKEFHVNFSRFTSFNSSHDLTLQLKSLTADGTHASILNSSATGTNLYNLVTTFPNTSGAFRYFRGNADTGLDIAITAGKMLFITCCQKVVQSATGVSCWVLLEKDAT